MNSSKLNIRSFSTSILALVMALGLGSTLRAESYIGNASFSGGKTTTAITVKSTSFPTSIVSGGKTYAISGVDSASSVTLMAVSDSTKSLTVSGCFDTAGGGSVKVSDLYTKFANNYFYITAVNVACYYADPLVPSSVITKTYTWTNTNSGVSKMRIVKYVASGSLVPEFLKVLFLTR